MLIWVRPDCGEGVFGKLDFSGVVAGDSENRQHTEKMIVWSVREVRMRKIQKSMCEKGVGWRIIEAAWEADRER